jgi:branched-chain amino acid transport system permease protein
MAFVQQLLNGLTIGAIYILLASGLTIAFGLQGIVNIAHGVFYMVGAYAAIDLYPRLGLPMTMFAVFVGVGGIGAFVEALAVRPLMGQHCDPMQIMASTLGVAIIASELIKFVWGPMPRLSSVPLAFAGTTSLFGLAYPTYWLFVVGFTALLMAALGLVINYTTLGAIVRAIAHNAEISEAMGVNVPRINSMMFALGAGVAGIAGVLAGPILSVYPTMCFDLLMTLFVVVILGGLGSIRGVVVSGVFVGVVTALGTAYLNGTIGTIAVFAAMIVVLIVRPQGLFGRAQFQT